MTTAVIESFEQRLHQNDDSVADGIAQFVQDHSATDGDHTRWGLLCEQAGLVGLAFHEFQLAVRDNRGDTVALSRLVEYYRERGDTDRAAAILERLLELNPVNQKHLEAYAELMRSEGALPRLEDMLKQAIARGLAPERAKELRGPGTAETDGGDGADQRATPSTSQPPAPAPTDADCVRFSILFAGREDVYARQWCRPNDRQIGYAPVHEPLTPAVIRNHLLGSYTVGVYPIRLDQTANWFAVDLDINRQALDHARRAPEFARQLRDLTRRTGITLLESLRDLELQPLFENSGYKGRHYWVFLEQPERAKVLHQLGRNLLRYLQATLPSEFSLEFFPKQGKRSGKGLGNLIKLPLGIHRRTGYRSQLLDDQGQALSDPLQKLRNTPRLSREGLYGLIQRLKTTVGPSALDTSENDEQPAGDEAARAEPTAPLLPPDVPPPWTEADFDADPRIHHLLAECPVLAELKRQVDQHRQLSHDEQVVLIHTMGHVTGGPQAVNYLLDKCVDVGVDAFMKSQLKGNPISCPKIRKRIGHVTRRVRCRCAFEFAGDHYPTPVLHMHTLSKDALPKVSEPDPESIDPDTLARRYTVLDQRRREIDAEWRRMHDAMCRLIRTMPDQSFQWEAGMFHLVEKEGVETLTWDVSHPGADSAGVSWELWTSSKNRTDRSKQLWPTPRFRPSRCRPIRSVRRLPPMSSRRRSMLTTTGTTMGTRLTVGRRPSTWPTRAVEFSSPLFFDGCASE